MSNIIDFPTKQYTMTPPVWSLIPEHMHDGVQRYIEHGILPGSFLYAVLCNDLTEAVMNADSINANHLVGYIKFLSAYCPSECWGTPERVAAWHLNGGLNFSQTK